MSRIFTVFLLLNCAACLEPAVSDDIDPARVFGDPDVPPMELMHVEDDPEYAANVETFPTQIAYLKGYAQSRSVWYWRVNGPNAEFIVPFLIINDAAGDQLQPPIIDVIPGDRGYSPWWRAVVYQVTEAYNGERIYSREAVDLAVERGLLTPGVESTLVRDCPVVQRDTTWQIASDGTTQELGMAIYRNRRVSWAVFQSSDIEVDVETNQMPIQPVWELQRINQDFILSEYATGVDLNGDNKITASNNIFRYDNAPNEPSYTPLWFPVTVRTVADYVSIDTQTGTVTTEFKSERDFFDRETGQLISDRAIPPPDRRREELINCPIQPAPI